MLDPPRRTTLPLIVALPEKLTLVSEKATRLADEERH
jgi:hypothetical protein